MGRMSVSIGGSILARRQTAGCVRTDGRDQSEAGPCSAPQEVGSRRVVHLLEGLARLQASNVRSVRLLDGSLVHTSRGFGAVGSALPWHGRGQGFESPKLHSL